MYITNLTFINSVYWIEVSKPSTDYETPQRSHLPSTHTQCRVKRSNTRMKQLQLKYCRKFSLGTTQNLKAELDCQMLKTKATNDIKNRISGINPLTSAILITKGLWGLDYRAKGLSMLQQQNRLKAASYLLQVKTTEHLTYMMFNLNILFKLSHDINACEITKSFSYCQRIIHNTILETWAWH